jgi:signal peptidase I
VPLYLAQATSSGENLRNTIDSLARTPLSEVLIFVAVLTVIRLAVAPMLKNTPAHLRSGAFGMFKFANEALDAIIYAAVFVFMIIRPFGVQTFLIPSGSMVNTLLVNDFIVANKAVYRYSEPKHGDIVVFRPPTRAIIDPKQIGADGEPKVDYIKRLIGEPGDLIEIKDGKLFRNSKPEVEKYVNYTYSRDGGQTFQFLPEDRAEMESQYSWKLVEYKSGVLPLMIRGEYINTPELTAPEYVLDPSEAAELSKKPAVKVPPGYFLMMGDNRNNSFDGRMWGLVPRDAIVGRSEAIWLPFSRWRITR